MGFFAKETADTAINVDTCTKSPRIPSHPPSQHDRHLKNKARMMNKNTRRAAATNAEAVLT